MSPYRTNRRPRPPAAPDASTRRDLLEGERLVFTFCLTIIVAMALGVVVGVAIARTAMRPFLASEELRSDARERVGAEPAPCW